MDDFFSGVNPSLDSSFELHNLGQQLQNDFVVSTSYASDQGMFTPQSLPPTPLTRGKHLMAWEQYHNRVLVQTCQQLQNEMGCFSDYEEEEEEEDDFDFYSLPEPSLGYESETIFEGSLDERHTEIPPSPHGLLVASDESGESVVHENFSGTTQSSPGSERTDLVQPIQEPEIDISSEEETEEHVCSDASCRGLRRLAAACVASFVVGESHTKHGSKSIDANWTVYGGETGSRDIRQYFRFNTQAKRKILSVKHTTTFRCRPNVMYSFLHQSKTFRPLSISKEMKYVSNVGDDIDVLTLRFHHPTNGLSLQEKYTLLRCMRTDDLRSVVLYQTVRDPECKCPSDTKSRTLSSKVSPQKQQNTATDIKEKEQLPAILQSETLRDMLPASLANISLESHMSHGLNSSLKGSSFIPRMGSSRLAQSIIPRSRISSSSTTSARSALTCSMSENSASFKPLAPKYLGGGFLLTPLGKNHCQVVHLAQYVIRKPKKVDLKLLNQKLQEMQKDELLDIRRQVENQYKQNRKKKTRKDTSNRSALLSSVDLF
eukprot:TRINITY_DN777941_c0_g1_i1.p1 TRINITY_DN777941_c0_g1~~TRINITY_DN777941_c0_g1_i1.p1  ORF type:complete len:544 (-),score=133.62 TRINITY_DN777941_c0_g1_i1:411-2042(-)